MKIDTFLIDIGNVLIGLNAPAAMAEVASFTTLSPAEIAARMVGETSIVEYESGRLSSDDFYRVLAEKTLLEVPFEKFRGSWLRIFDPALHPGRYISPAMLKGLGQRYRLIAVSNTNEMHFDYLEQTFPWIGEFDDLVLSHRVGSVKPEEKIFRVAIERAGCRPDQLFFVDDLADNVEAARRLGIRGHVFSTQADLCAELESLGLFDCDGQSQSAAL